MVEIVWRIVGLLDLGASPVGVRPRKKMYFGIIIPVIDRKPLASKTHLQPQVASVIEIYNRACNIDARFNGFFRPPGGTITATCRGGGFFADWWRASFELVSRIPEFESSWRLFDGRDA